MSRITCCLAGWLCLVASLYPFTATPQVRVGGRARLERMRYAIPSGSSVFVPFILAHKKGYYTEEGIEAQLLRMAGGLSVRANVAGSIEFNGSQGSIDAAVRGIPVKMLMVVVNKADYDLFTQPHIKSFQALRGKTIGIASLGGLYDLVTREILRKNGLAPEEVVLLVVGPPEVAFVAMKAKTIDGGLLSLPHNLLAKEAGFHHLAYPGDYVASATGGLSSTDKVIREEAERVQRFVRGSLKGLLAFRTLREEAVTAVMEYTGLKDRSFARQVYDYQVARTTSDGSLSEELQRELIARSLIAGKLTVKRDNREVFDMGFVHRAAQELRGSGWRP